MRTTLWKSVAKSKRTPSPTVTTRSALLSVVVHWTTCTVPVADGSSLRVVMSRPDGGGGGGGGTGGAGGGGAGVDGGAGKRVNMSCASLSVTSHAAAMSL
jgi:hypothetical protein